MLSRQGRLPTRHFCTPLICLSTDQICCSFAHWLACMHAVQGNSGGGLSQQYFRPYVNRYYTGLGCQDTGPFVRVAGSSASPSGSPSGSPSSSPSGSPGSSPGVSPSPA